MRRRANIVGVFAALGALLSQGEALGADSPHLSEQYLPSSNGLAAIAWDRTQSQARSSSSSTRTRRSRRPRRRGTSLYDSYPGVRVGTTGTWLDTASRRSSSSTCPGTGIVHAHARRSAGSTLDEYDFAPMGLARERERDARRR